AWERFALLKARPIAGDLEVGEEALRHLQPFVFRKYFDLKAIDDMRRLKARAEKEAARAAGVDLKLGKGGIREIEFFVQALQLLHGGRHPNLRVPGTLKAAQRRARIRARRRPRIRKRAWRSGPLRSRSWASTSPTRAPKSCSGCPASAARPFTSCSRWGLRWCWSWPPLPIPTRRCATSQI